MNVNTIFLLLYWETSSVWTGGQVYHESEMELEVRKVMMEDGGRGSLVCQSDLPWLLCTWSLLSTPQSQHCALLTDGQVRPLDCQGNQAEDEDEDEDEDETGDGVEVEVEEVEVVGNSSWCGLEVGRVVRRHQAGLWTCSLSSLQAGRLVTSHTEDIRLEVVSRGELSLLVETNNQHQQYWVSPALSLSFSQ